MSIINCDEYYLKKYDKFIQTIVNAFIARGNCNSLNIKEDLLQEAKLALIKWLSKIEDIQKVEIFRSAKTIKRALYEYVKQNTGFHMRANSLREFCNNCSVIELNETDCSYDIEENDYLIDFQRWKRSLSDRQRNILNLKIHGFTNTEIAGKIHVDESTVYRNIADQLRPSYNAYFNHTAA